MTNPITPLFGCDEFNESLADFLERDVRETTRAAMDAHALSCAECGALLADLRKLRIDAANLPELVPSRDLWAGIAERIETPVVAIGPTGQQANRRGPRTRLWIGLAAAGLVAITATITHQVTKRVMIDSAKVAASVARVDSTPKPTLSTPPAPATATATATQVAAAPAAKKGSVPPVTRSTVPAATLASNKLTPEQTYTVEIARLRKIVDHRRAELDSSTVVVLEKNLKIIDDAIAACRLALRRDPASAYLNDSLNDALDSKVQLLRSAATLPAKM